MWEYLRAYQWVAEGYLPFGQIADQSEKFMLAMETIRVELRKIEKVEVRE